MKEIYGNAWDLFDSGQFDVLFITTNGTIKKNGEGVMGRGIAAEAKNRYPDLPAELGDWLKILGNKPSVLKVIGQHSSSPTFLMSFPVKHNWYEQADIELIKASCEFLTKRFFIGPSYEDWKFLLPRPGCGNGHLNWEDVKKEIEPLLDDRFYIVHFKEDNNDSI